MQPKVDDLVGMAAGMVCRVLDNPAGAAIEPVVAAAQEIAYDQDLMMSAWTFMSIDGTGATAWKAPDGSQIATVDGDGRVTVRAW